MFFRTDKQYFFALLMLSLLNLRLFASFYVPVDWSTYVGGVYGNDCVKASAIDSLTNAYFGGYLGDFSISNDDGVAFTNEPFSTPLDGFVAQVNSLGVLQWYNVLGDNENDEVRGIAEQGQSVFAAACLERTATYDDGTDAFLYSLSKTDGSVNWSYSIGAMDATNAFNAVTVDTNGNIYAVGYTSIAGLTPSYGTSLHGNLDACVVKISSTGSLVWVHYLGGANEDRALTCTIGTNGFLYVGGETYSSGWVSHNGGFTPSTLNKAGFVVKLSTAGDHIWSTYLDGSGNYQDSVAGLAFENVSGKLFAVGSTRSSGFMSSMQLNSYGGNGDGFVSSITDNGSGFTVNWSKFYGSNQTDTVTSIQQLSGSQMVIGGTTSAGGWLPNADNTFHGGVDGFTAVFATDGASLSSHYIGGPGNDYTYTVAAAGDDFYAGGLTLSTNNWVSEGFHVTWDKAALWEEEVPPDKFGFLVKYIRYGYIPDLPTIITQPKSISVEEKQNALFTVVAVSAEPLSYQWYTNSSPFLNATNKSFTLSSVTLAQNGTLISCSVSNIAGSVISTNATLTVTAIPMGWITMNLLPPAAVSNGAAWSIDAGTNWLASGDMVNVLTGVYSITNRSVFGWAAPATTNTTVLNLKTNTLDATFTEIIYSNARYITGTNVVVKVIPPAGTFYFVLTETLPAGLTPCDYPASANWYPATSNLIYFVGGASPVQFSYSVTGTNGIYQLSGSVNFGLGGVPTVGADTIIIGAEPPSVVPPPDPDIIGFAPDSGAPGSWRLTFISILDQLYLIETNGAPAAAGWAQQSQKIGVAGQTTTSVAAPGETLFYRVRTPAP